MPSCATRSVARASKTSRNTHEMEGLNAVEEAIDITLDKAAYGVRGLAQLVL